MGAGRSGVGRKWLQMTVDLTIKTGDVKLDSVTAMTKHLVEAGNGGKVYFGSRFQRGHRSQAVTAESTQQHDGETELHTQQPGQEAAETTGQDQK